MAIDDNTLYGLTGAQVKELPEKIEAVKGLARELTADDYNYPTNNPDGVALWLLPRGLYTYNSPTKVYFDNTGYYPNQSRYKTFLVYGSSGVNVYALLFSDTAFNGNYYNRILGVNGSTGARYTEAALAPVVNNTLASTSTYDALSANQGKVLNDKIGGDLSNLTTTDKTSLINAINEIAGQGGGGVTELTSADYDWPENNPDGVALWLLPAGLYHTDAGVKSYYTREVAGASSNSTFIVGGVDESSTQRNIVRFDALAGGAQAFLYAVKTTGYFQASQAFLTTSSVVQTTGTSTTSVMSQNATTSMVFADPSTQTKVKIGSGTASQIGYAGVEIGATSQADGVAGVALGTQTRAAGANSVAIGAYSASAAQGVVSFGGNNLDGAGYNNSKYRLLTNIYDPQSAHDAATKGYVDTAVAGAGASAFTTNEWNALWA